MEISYRVHFDDDESPTNFGPPLPSEEAARGWAAENGTRRPFHIVRTGPNNVGAGTIIEG